ncbi:MAG: transcription termination factor NusA [candidate division WOR-3 bacterium]
MKLPLLDFIAEIHTKRRLSRELVVAVLRDSIVKALSRNHPGCNIVVDIDLKKGAIDIRVEKKVVEDVEKATLEFRLAQDESEEPKEPCFISLEEARAYSESAIPGGTVQIPIPFESLDRSTVYRIKNIFTQRIREAVKYNVFKEFQSRVGELEIVDIQKVDPKQGVFVTLRPKLGAVVRAEGIIPPEEQIPGERYRQGTSMKALILSVGGDDESKRGQIILSRAHNDFLRRFLEQEINEIMEGMIEIKAVARIPGKRSKVAVRSKDPMMDPVGTCVGHKGTRISKVIKAIGGEKIDVIKWEPDTIRLAFNALSPIVPITVYPEEDRIVAVVEDEDVESAKGEEGANVKLASGLVGKRVDIITRRDYKPVPGVVTLIDLEKKLPKNVLSAMRNRGLTSFTSIPTLAQLHSVVGLDEKSSLKILEVIESILESGEEIK